ncbi:MAG: C39 family peptidase [Candidatus Andersenbacteria bacterium]
MTTRTTRRSILVALALLLLAGAALAAWKFDLLGRFRTYQADRERNDILSSFSNDAAQPAAVPELTNTSNTTGWSNAIADAQPAALPDKVLLKVQFIPQAPLDPGPVEWAKHAESCEEAAALMAHNYAVGRTVTLQQADDEIYKLVAWQKKTWGDEHDVYADEEAVLLRDYYGHTDVRVLKDVTVDDIKRELAAGYPVIVPTIAAPLHNPRYREQGYHMFVLVGYTADRLIANDNGTTWGGDYPYPYSDLMAALKATGGDAVVIHK